MKKIAIFIIIVIIIICGITYLYLNYKANYNISKKTNLEFENYLNQEIYGADLSTVINRAVDSNETNNVTKNNKGIYEDNNKDSIKIEIKMIDNDSIYPMETFYNNGMQEFINYYSNIKFKCVNIKYHEKTQKIKYMLFEQITS